MNKITLDALAVLDAIDNHGSFGAAAKALHRVPSAITYTIQKLESDLGIEIFDRSGHRAKITTAGKELLREGRELLRAAMELELHAQRVAYGWEPELRITVDHLIPARSLLALITEFDHLKMGTRLRLTREVWGGTWDALIWERAELAIGATGEGPSGSGVATYELGSLHMLFCVSPSHPVAKLEEPLASDELRKHRAVAAGDTARQLKHRTMGLLDGQDVLLVADLNEKLEAQRRGLGVGFLPEQLAKKEAEAGRLLIKQVENHPPDIALHIAWNSNHNGKALQWFVKNLKQPEIRDALLDYGGFA